MYLKIKRLIDIIFAFLGLIILCPIFFIFMCIIKIESKGPIFFKQKRIGINKRNFFMLKFRTMKIETPKDTPTHLLENPDQWITRFGKILRKTSLDELPQIWNIFTGDMSLIGPRPALWNQYDLISEREKYGANDVPAGLTGWAQVNGRDEISIEEKAKFDGEYVQKFGFIMDTNCFFKSILVVVKRDGIIDGKQ